MGSKGRIPHVHLRHPLPGPGMVDPDSFGPPIRPTRGGFPHFDVLPPPEIMEQKLASQHVEMQKLATENQRLAGTHETLRQELAAAQHELQILHAHIGEMKSETEQQMRGIVDKITRMEAECRAADHIKMELQQARAEAQGLVAERQDLISKVQQLTQQLQRASSDVQQIPFLLSELDGLRQEYQLCRATYDYEKKLYSDHLESLQVMEKNYLTMAGEVEKLRTELTNPANFDRRSGGPSGGPTGYNENDTSGNYPVGQNLYSNGYGISQGRGLLSGGASGAGAGADGAGGAGGVVGSRAATPPAGVQSGPGHAPAPAPAPAPGVAAYDAYRVSRYDTQRGPAGPSYDPHRPIGGPGYDVQRGAPPPAYQAQRGQDGQRGPGYEAHRRTGYDQHGSTFDGHGALMRDTQRGSGYDAERGSYDPAKRAGYDLSSRATGPQGQVAPVNNAPYGSAAPPAHGAGIGYEAPPRGGNAVRR